MNASRFPSNVRYLDDYALQRNAVSSGLLSELLISFDEEEVVPEIDNDMVTNEISNYPALYESEAFASGISGTWSNQDVYAPLIIEAAIYLGSITTHNIAQGTANNQSIYSSTDPQSYYAGSVLIPHAQATNAVAAFGMPGLLNNDVSSVLTSSPGIIGPSLGTLGLLTFGDLISSWVKGTSVPAVSADEAGVASSPFNSILASLDNYEAYAVAGWDGYDAQPITSDTVAAAKTLVTLFPTTAPTPNAAPGVDGTIGFEWRFKSGPLRKLFIDVGPSEKILIYSEPLRGYPETQSLGIAQRVNSG